MREPVRPLEWQRILSTEGPQGFKWTDGVSWYAQIWKTDLGWSACVYAGNDSPRRDFLDLEEAKFWCHITRDEVMGIGILPLPGMSFDGNKW
jgi:hypothetical protein